MNRRLVHPTKSTLLPTKIKRADDGVKRKKRKVADRPLRSVNAPAACVSNNLSPVVASRHRHLELVPTHFFFLDFVPATPT